MKLLTGVAPGQDAAHVFVLIDDRAVQLAAGDLTGIVAAVAAGGALPRPAPDAPTHDPATILPALPITRPGKILCLGLNFAEHAREGGHAVPDYPAMFMRASTSMVAAEAPMILPDASVTFDYEAELMVIVGKGGRHIAEADALEHVFGYTTFNDGSVREYQRKSAQWTAGKNFDCTGAVGPVVVTPDEVPPGADGLRISTRLNGVVLQDSTTSDMIFPVARTIAIVSEIMTLEPGDMIAFGTPQGVGHARRPQVWMKAGDVVEVEIEGIGTCRNPVVAEADRAARGAAAE
jgi:2-keto-4-pentenoate hydratase/2-oxohepta-3-ene-1,7-dioic acid hydratase in catechol pathway